MVQDFLSNVELYYHPSIETGVKVEIVDDEAKHILQVMRHKPGDVLYITNGKGSIFRCKILSISKNSALVFPEEKLIYKNTFGNITFCLPILKNFDRLEFALEKCIELGITSFIFYQSRRSINKKPKIERWEKVALSAMKQSLRSFFPKLKYVKNLDEIVSLQGNLFLFDQSAEQSVMNTLNEFDSSLKYYFLFGPEGGFADCELELFEKMQLLRLTENRLRSETAVIYLAALLVASTG